MKVGGRDFNQTKEDVERAMRGTAPEELRKYLVEVNGQPYPPKQVLAHVTGWKRQSFTTMEAQRVLNKLGFVCREAGLLADGRAAWLPYSGKGPSPAYHLPGGAVGNDIDVPDRMAALEAALVTAQEAIAGLSARVRALEESRG